MTSKRITTFTLNPALDHMVKLDHLSLGNVNKASDSVFTPGGKGFTVACCVADYGYNVVRTGGFIGDENSTPFRRYLIKRGIIDFFIHLPGVTRINTVIVDSSLDQTTNINLPGIGGITRRHVDELLNHIDYKEGELVAIGGSLAAGMDLDTYPHMIKYLKSKGTTVLLDTSGDAFSAAMKSDCLPDCIKPNRSELSQLVGKELKTLGEVVNAARVYLEKGIGKVIVSLGSKGALFLEKKEAIYATLPAISTPNSTVGAGDALVGGTMYAWSRNFSLETLARYGMAFAINKLLSHDSYLSADSIDEWSGKVNISHLSDELLSLDVTE